MTEGIITPRHTELERISVIRSIISRQLTQAQAAQQLKPGISNLSVRQARRLSRAYRTYAATFNLPQSEPIAAGCWG